MKKLFCRLGFHDIGWRDTRTGIFLHSMPSHYDGQTICWKCAEYRKDGIKVRDDFYDKKIT